MSKRSRSVKPKKQGRGRPRVEDKILRNGLTSRQWKTLKQEADSRGLPSRAYVLREAVDWYLAALESARSGSVATPEQDAQHEKIVASKSKHSKT